MHVVLVSIGTDGDIFPYVGLGAALRARGHRVTLVASGHYEALAQRHGFEFGALVSAEENRALFEHPDFWNPWKTAPLMARWAVGLIPRQYELLSQQITPETVLVANPGVLAASLVHEKLGVPWTNLVLQPWMIRSSVAPPLMPNFPWLAHAPRPVWQGFWRCLDLVVDTLLGRELNRFRTSLGLKPTRWIFRNWLSRQLVIGMFPDWYGPPQSDWPSQMRLAGFPMFDGGKDVGLTSEVLDFCRAGKPPVAFTFGTGMAHSRELFRTALEACEILGVRALLLTRFREQLPDTLPSSVLPCAFAPFQKLFPQCAAVVHHGGIGTTAKAMAAGVPQVIHPLCFDQLDNGARVQRLGVGHCLRNGRSTGKQLAAALAAVMTGNTRTRGREVMKRFHPTDPCVTAAEWVETLSSHRV